MNVALLALTVVAAQTSHGVTDSRAPESTVVVGYLYGPARDIDFSLYTHICHAFITAGPDGRLNANTRVPDAKLTRTAHAHNVKVLLSLGGWGWDEQFAGLVKDANAEARYVRSVIQMVDAADYDGIDLDWEYPDNAEEVSGFERVSRKLRSELAAIAAQKGRPLFLTMAASSNPGTLSWLDPAFLVEVFDWVNVMTYDMAGDWTDFAGHNAPLFQSSRQPDNVPRSIERSIEYLLEERKVPADHIALGIPLYGRGFAVAEPYASTSKAKRYRIPGGGDYANLKSLLDKGKWTRRWDPETKTPWLLAPDHSAVVGYDDVESVVAKGEWAKSKNLRGVFYWQIHGDRLPDESHPLQEAAIKTLGVNR